MPSEPAWNESAPPHLGRAGASASLLEVERSGPPIELAGQEVVSTGAHRFERAALLGIPVSRIESLQALVDWVDGRLQTGLPGLITYAGLQSWAEARRDPTYLDLVSRFDVIAADGFLAVKALRWATGLRVARLSPDRTSYYVPVFSLLEAHRARLFVVGGSPGTADAAVRRMRGEFPAVEYVGTAHGFGDTQETIDRILTSGASVVWCGMGTPHQARFLARLQDAGFDGLGFACGGFLEQLSERTVYYPEWMDRLNLRWAYRFYREPRRLWRRYLVEAPHFILRVAANRILRRGHGRRGARPAQGVAPTA